MVIGRRTNVLLNDSQLYLPDNVTEMARQRGELFIPYAVDYFFITSNDFPWHRVPDVVVGRPAYDNFLVGMAIQQNVSVVDATATLLAFHQTDMDGNFAGFDNEDAEFNIIRIGQFNYESGLTTSAQYVTRFSDDMSCNSTQVIVERRYRWFIPLMLILGLGLCLCLGLALRTINVNITIENKRVLGGFCFCLRE